MIWQNTRLPIFGRSRHRRLESAPGWPESVVSCPPHPECAPGCPERALPGPFSPRAPGPWGALFPLRGSALRGIPAKGPPCAAGVREAHFTLVTEVDCSTSEWQNRSAIFTRCSMTLGRCSCEQVMNAASCRSQGPPWRLHVWSSAACFLQCSTVESSPVA